MLNRCYCVVALLVLAVSAVFAGSAASAAETNTASRAAQREAIRSMPLVSRPNRPGHIYGNNVRRLHHLRNGRR